jgi:serine/threonine protein kinase/tetratricopeptide (TPR) repeat protein
MPQALSCPEKHDLQRYVLGQFADADAERLGQHLMQCQRCLALVTQLEASDSLVEAMRGQAAGEEPEKEMVENLLSRVRHLQPLQPGVANQAGRLNVQAAPPDTPHASDVAMEPYVTRTLVGETPDLEQKASISASEISPDRLAVPGYEILGELGRGGMGVVYKARQTSLNRLVALKMILSGAHAGATDLARFRSEAEAAARLQHPHIVQIYEIGEHEGRPYIALEFVDGGSLDKKVKGTPQNPDTSAELVQTIAQAMHAAHERGVIHRDLKPGNILLSSAARPSDFTSGGRGTGARRPGAETPSPSHGLRTTEFGLPKITDFGLAKQLTTEPLTNRTPSGIVVGTPNYMSPEQAKGNTSAIGPAADTYALGAVLYELLTGRPPFAAATPLDTLWQVISEEPVPPTRLQPKVPHDLETICLKCLQKEPHRRYASALELASDLGRFLAGEPIQARPVSMWERGLKWTRRRPLAAALAAVSVLAVVSLVLAYTESQRRGRAHAEAARVAAEAETKATQRKMDELKRLQKMREEVQSLLSKGQKSLENGDAKAAGSEFASARALIRSDSGLEEFRADTDRWLTEADRRLTEQKARDAFRARYPQFCRLRDQALFHESQFTGLDLPGNLEALRQTAGRALELFRKESPAPVADISSWALDLGQENYFSDREKQEIRAGCYELLLILAEATAPPMPAGRDASCCQTALRIMDRAATLRPATRSYHLRRSEYLRGTGDGAAAEKERQRAGALRPQDAVDYFLLGDETYRRGEWSTAIAYFENTLRLEPEHFWARFLIAFAYLQSGRADQAVSNWTVCQSRQPRFPWIYILRGVAYGELGYLARTDKRSTEAELHFAAALADFRKAQENLALEPDSNASYTLIVNRGFLHLRQRQFEDAVRDLQEAIRLKPSQVQAYINLAEVYKERHQSDQAVAQLDRAIKLQPKLTTLYFRRGRLALELKDPSRALQDFDKVIRLLEPVAATPNERELLAETHAQRGRILHEQRRYDDAQEAYTAALKVLPDYPLALRSRGTLLYERQRYAEASRDFDAYLSKWKPMPRIYEARGLTRTRRADYAGAVADYSRALDLEPKSAHLHVLRGWTYLVAEAPGLALRDFQSAIRQAPDGDAYAGRGYSYVKLGYTDLAVADAIEALQRGPLDARMLYNAARIFAQAVGRMDVDRRQQDHQGLEKRSSYQDRAVQLIRKALDMTPQQERGRFWMEKIEPANAGFDPIRGSSAFSRLAVEYIGQK